MKARISDRSGGFWIYGLKRGFDVVIRQDLIPNPKVARLIGMELISSIKGSVKHRIGVSFRNGRAIYNMFPNGRYPYGILHGKSPEGKSWEPLKYVTLKHRKWKAKIGEIPVARPANFILRETSQNIFHAMSVSKAQVQKNGKVRVEISFENPKLADLHNKGGNVSTDWFGKGPRGVKIPARPFIGIQKEFVSNFSNIIRQL